MNVLTFDIEEWFHILDDPATESVSDWPNFEVRIHRNVDRLLDILERHACSATFFCLGWIVERYPEVVRKIADCGYEIGSHSMLHPLVYGLTPEQFNADLQRSIQTLEDTVGKKVRAFRAPGFSIVESCDWALDVLVQNGIELDSSLFIANRAHGGCANWGAKGPHRIQCTGGMLKEFPIIPGGFLGREFVFSGGGYFRLLPYRTVARMARRTDYVMTYFHPRDFDPAQPVLDIPAKRRFKSYIGLRGAQAKLERWLSDESFIDLGQADEQTDWDNLPVIQRVARDPEAAVG